MDWFRSSNYDTYLIVELLVVLKTRRWIGPEIPVESLKYEEQRSRAGNHRNGCHGRFRSFNIQLSW
jgi:hypothetical protein